MGRKKNPILTIEQANAIMELKGGVDVYNYSLAKLIREMERSGIEDLFDITKPAMYTDKNADRMPYFGAIATKKGLRIAYDTIKGRRSSI